MKWAAAIAGAALWAAISVADAQTAVTVIGNGNLSCGVWTARLRQQDGDTVALSGALMNGAWLDGYLSGYNAYANKIIDVIKNLDLEARDGWVRNYCLSHPLDPIYRAAQELILELQRRAAQR
jgi:hypothetical protein